MSIAKIYIEGIIGEDWWFPEESNTLKTVRGQFEAFEEAESVQVFIDSVGGDVQEGLAIFDYLLGLDVPVTTINQSKAYSAGSIIFLAGDEDKRLVSPNSSTMIHLPWTLVSGNSKELAEVVEELQAYDEKILNIYTERTGIAEAIIENLMLEEKFMSADEVLELGFASGTYEGESSIKAEDRYKFKVAALAYTKDTRPENFESLIENKMKENTDKTVLAKIKSLLGMTEKVEAKVEEVETVVVEEKVEAKVEEVETTETETDRLAQLEATVISLSETVANLQDIKAEADKKVEDAESAKALAEEKASKLEAEISENSKELEAVLAKLEEVENLPIKQTEKVVNTVKKEKAEPHKLDGFAAMIQNRLR